MNIPFVDLRAELRAIQSEMMIAIENVLKNMQPFLRSEAQAFEQEFAEYCGYEFGVECSNATDALTLALRTCGIGHGHEVIIVSNAFIEAVEAIALVGATHGGDY